MLCIQKAPTQVGDVLQQHDIDRCRVLGAIKNSPAAAVQGVVLELIANPFERRARLRQGVAPAAAGEFDSSVVGAQQTRLYIAIVVADRPVTDLLDRKEHTSELSH